jgi:hypothetical protein
MIIGIISFLLSLTFFEIKNEKEYIPIYIKVRIIRYLVNEVIVVSETKSNISGINALDLKYMIRIESI